MYDEDCLSRPDIYGLTAIGTASIIINHAFPSIIPGGFVGFDVLLVISGYLSSAIIIMQIKNNRFSLIEFYSSRVKQVCPNLLLVMFFVFFSALKIF
jgi:peptidoglycan/LPS O-acetylase OafA/YrhL